MNGFVLTVGSFTEHFASPDCNRKPRRTVSSAMTLLSFLAFGVISSTNSVTAQSPSRRLEIQKSPTLTSRMIYWFVGTDKSVSERKLFPNPSQDGTLSIEVPQAFNKPGAFLKILDVSRHKISRIPIVAVEQKTALGPDLIRNGDFSLSFDNWLIDESGAAHMSKFELPTSVKGVPGRAVQLQISSIDKENWRTQFLQNNLDFQDGRTYTLTYWARADRVRPFLVQAAIDQGDYHQVGLNFAEPLTKEWKQYKTFFVATATMPNHNRLSFTTGDAVGTVELAGVSLREGRIIKSLGDNILRNSDFDKGIDSWITIWDKGAEAAFSFPTTAEVPLPPGMTGKVCRVDVKKIGANPYDVILGQPRRELKDGEAYTFSFWAKANRDRTITAEVAVEGEDYHSVGLRSEVSLTEDWHRYSFAFTASKTIANANRAGFFLGAATGTVDFTHIELHPGLENVKKDGMVENPLIALNEDSFQFVENLKIPISYKGMAVKQAGVYLEAGGSDFGGYLLKSSDYGAARFDEIPIGKPLIITVTHNGKKAVFNRTLLVNSSHTLQDLDVPGDWTKLKLFAQLRSAPIHPLIGQWESFGQQETIIGQEFERYQFSFHPDETGTLEVVSFKKDTGNESGAPRTEPFKWSISEGSQRIMLGSHVYTWVIQKVEGTSQLTLKGDNGKTYVLFRN